MSSDRPHTLDREITICARRDTVFRYFTDSERFARWWGQGSTIEGRKGGSMFIRNPDGSTARGEVLEIDPPSRIVFTFANAGESTADASRVSVTLDENERGTVLKLHHAFRSAKIRDHFIQGWRYQLAVFSKVLAEENLPALAGRVDSYLQAWGDPDAETRRRLLTACATKAIVFRDAYSATDGLEELLAHLEAIQIHMPGMRLVREGDVRLSHGTAIAGWKAVGPDGSPKGQGTNVYDLSPDGLLARVVGFWG
jgi:uncharacterized protein YndB with AHSA1/START domain